MFRFVLVTLLVALATPLVVADEDAPKDHSLKKAADRKIGIVDMNRLFKTHAELKRKLIALQAAATLEQAKFESQLKTLAKKAEKLKDLTPESRDYKSLEEESVREKARIQAEIGLTKKDFEQREARLYLEAYQEIKKDVEKLAKSQHLTLVLNASLDEINEGAKPEDIARAISNKVVWCDNSIDLTPQLERNYTHCPVPSAGGKQSSLAVEPRGHGSRPARAAPPAASLPIVSAK